VFSSVKAGDIVTHLDGRYISGLNRTNFYIFLHRSRLVSVEGYRYHRDRSREERFGFKAERIKGACFPQERAFPTNSQASDDHQMEQGVAMLKESRRCSLR